jgi:hypothetical protein
MLLGVNGSQPELATTMRPYEMDSTLNDEEGVWLASHGSNRYREWDELRYSMRSVEEYAGAFTNRIQILVNAFEEYDDNGTQVQKMGKQQPCWLKRDAKHIQVLSQEEFFGPEERKCLPSFDSLTIENQLYNIKSETDRVCRRMIHPRETTLITTTDLRTFRRHDLWKTTRSFRLVFASLRSYAWF